MGARYYEASAGRFISRDSVDGASNNPISQNHYIYAGANPVGNIDPSGHDFSLGELTVSIGAGENVDTEDATASHEVFRTAVNSNQFTVYAGIERGGGSFGFGPHTFIFVNNTETHYGQKYDILDDGRLRVHGECDSAVLSTKKVGLKNHIKIADFSTVQYAFWTSTAYILAENNNFAGDFQLTQRSPEGYFIRTILEISGLKFSYSFLSGTINCFKWTFYAALSAKAATKVRV